MKLEDNDANLPTNFQNIWQAIFTGNLIEPSFPAEIPQSLGYACLLFRLLHDVALDIFDRPPLSGKSPNHRQPSLDHQRSIDSPIPPRRHNINTQNLAPPPAEPIIIHSGIVVGMLHLLPSIYDETKPDMALSLQLFVAEVIKSLVRSERNQQVMCDAGMSGELLNIGRIALQDETHPLHPPLQYIIERLSAQSLESKDLR